jgi:L-iditol 2-dehydrogenase
MECGIPCSKPTCFFCRTGRYNACPEVVFFSTPPYHGTLRRYHVHPEAWLHAIPDNMSFEEGSLLEPLSVALAGIDRSGLRLGDPIVICGAGPIGLVCLLAAHAAGAAPIVITDLDENRLAAAKQLVPRVRTVLVDRSLDAKGLGEMIVASLETEARLVLECTGVESSIHAGIYVSSYHILDFVSHTNLSICCLGLRIWRNCFCHWCWQRFSKHPLHASLKQRDRPSI